MQREGNEHLKSSAAFRCAPLSGLLGQSFLNPSCLVDDSVFQINGSSNGICPYFPQRYFAASLLADCWANHFKSFIFNGCWPCFLLCQENRPDPLALVTLLPFPYKPYSKLLSFPIFPVPYIKPYHKPTHAPSRKYKISDLKPCTSPEIADTPKG